MYIELRSVSFGAALACEAGFLLPPDGTNGCTEVCAKNNSLSRCGLTFLERSFLFDDTRLLGA